MTREEQNLLRVQTIFFFAGSLASLFLNVFLFKTGGLISAVKFNLFSLTFLLIWYLASGWLYRKFTSTIFMKISFLLFVLLFFLLYLLKEQAVHFLFILGMINGTAQGNFWAANNLAQYISTHEKTRNQFFGRQNFWLNLSQTAGPIIGGLLIGLLNFLFHSSSLSYSLLFLLVSLLMFYLLLETKKIPGFKNIEFQLSHILRHKRSRNWKLVLFQQGLYGLWDVIFGVFSGILVYIIVKEELILGGVRTVGALIFALASLWAAKVLQKKKHAFLLGAIFAPLGLFIFAWQENWWGILSLTLLVNSFLPFLTIPTSKVIYDVIDKVEEPWQRKYHFLLERDAVLGLARITSYLILLPFILDGQEIEIAKTYLLIIPLFPLLTGLSFFLSRPKYN